MNISNIIKKRRKELGMTLFEVANKVGVSAATVQRWESGSITNLRHGRIAKIAEALDIHPGELIEWIEPDFKRSNELDIQWAELIKELKKQGLTPEQVKKIIDAVRDIREVSLYL